MKLILFTLAFFLCYTKIFSQNELKIEHVSLENGVSNNLIFSIYQDSKGFLWLGTMYGLVKYDGAEYKTYRYDPLDSNSLSNDDVISIFEDRDGNLWFGTYNGGLNKYNRKTGNFTRYIHDDKYQNTISSNTVWSIYQDRKGIMWFGTDEGLNKFENEKFTVYKSDTTKQNGISGNVVRCMAEDKDGNLWLGTAASGLNKLDVDRKTFTRYKHDKENDNSLSNNFITSILEDKDGEMWFATGRGLNKFNKQTGYFKRYFRDSTNNKSISSNIVYCIREDSDGSLLIGTQKGFNRFYKSSEEFEKIKIYPENPEAHENVLTFIKDNSGVIWASTYLDGLHKLYYPSKKFGSFLPKNDIKSIYQDKSNILYIGTTNGLEVSTDGGNSFITTLSDKKSINSLSSNLINSITGDSSGNIWIGTDNGLNKWEKHHQKFIHYKNNPSDIGTISSNNVSKVYIDRSGNLWIGTDKGLNKFIQGSDVFERYGHSLSDTSSLNENSILSIYEDKNEILWIGTYRGLNMMDKETGKFRHFKQKPGETGSISNNYVYSFCEDENNNFWIGTGGGLNIFDRNTGSFINYAVKNGLPNPVISGIEFDSQGYLWLSTLKGISKLDIKNKEFKNFDTDDGLLTNMFNTGAYFKNGTGEIFFGGINGVTYFNPLQMQVSKFIPEVVISSITKFNDNKKYVTELTSLKNIELNYDDNIINFDFASLDFTNPKKNQYAYMLEGFDKDWIYSGNVNQAVYTNLDPGHYIFKVKGTNSDRVWNEKEASIILIIQPPFWKTWWFYVLMISSAVILMLLIHRYFVRRKVKYKIEIERIKEHERELMREQASRDYHDELGHKLTRISMYSRRINKKLRPGANGLTDDLNSIVETSQSLQAGAKDLIWTMNPREDTLYDLTVRLRDFGNEMFENSGMNFTADGIDEKYRNIFLSMNSKRHLIYIFKEGMNNILKYSRAEKVNLNFSSSENELEIILEDNGEGFDVYNCQKGYGLKNIFSRASQINSKVDILSSKHSGTKIVFKTNIKKLTSA